MTVDEYIKILKNTPEEISFQDTISVIDEYYHFKETSFFNGQTENIKGENNGSCKIFAFSLLNGFSESETLHCFGDFYRLDVLGNPSGSSHVNIRNFIQYGWARIKFSSKALALK